MIQCFTFTQPIANINKKRYKEKDRKKFYNLYLQLKIQILIDELKEVVKNKN